MTTPNAREREIARRGKMLSETELLPCPFCGGKATRQDIEYDTMGAEPDDENYGGSFIECDDCGACSAVHFDRENLVDSWNRRAALSHKDSQDVE